MEQTWLDEDTALKAAARKGWGFESLLLRHLFIRSRFVVLFHRLDWLLTAHTFR